MPLLTSTQISWSEPWFFLIRIREPWGWRRRIGIAIGAALLMALAIYFFQPGGQRGVAGAAGLGLACGALLLLLMDMRNVQRDVVVKDDCIIVGSSMGRGWFETFSFDAISGVHLIRPAEWSKPYGGMVIGSPEHGFLVAVPRKVDLETVANILHRLKVRTTLSDWEPPESDTRTGVRDEVPLDPAAALGQIEVQAVDEQEEKLLKPAHIAVQVLIALGPLVAALAGAILAAVILVRNWDGMSLIDKGLYGGGAAAALILSFLYLVFVGQFIAASYGIRVARQRLQLRPQALVRGSEDDLVCVELFDRESWTATVAKSADYGFLRIDRPQHRLVFEGNKSRWKLPFSALTACRIEESIVGSEANAEGEKRYHVALASAQGEVPWETGIVYTRTDLGNDSSESRYKRAQLLFTQLESALLPSGRS